MRMQNRSVDVRGMRMLSLLAGLALALLVAVVIILIAKPAHGGEPVLTVMQRQAVYFEDRNERELKAVQLQDLATAIEFAAQEHPPGVSVKDWQALLMAVSYAESTWSLRIARGDCKPHECDGGRARSPWQIHRNGMSDQDWEAMQGLANVNFQAEKASAVLRRAFLTCKGSGVPWVMGTLNNYAGRKCSDDSWDGLVERGRIFSKIRTRL